MRAGYLTSGWIVATLGVAGYLTFNLVGEDRSLPLPGETSDGHHQIELACESVIRPWAAFARKLA